MLVTHINNAIKDYDLFNKILLMYVRSILISFFMAHGAKEWTYRLIVNDYRRPWTPASLEVSQVGCWPFGGWGVGWERGWGMGRRYSHSLAETQRKRGFILL